MTILFSKLNSHRIHYRQIISEYNLIEQNAFKRKEIEKQKLILSEKLKATHKTLNQLQNILRNENKNHKIEINKHSKIN